MRLPILVLLVLLLPLVARAEEPAASQFREVLSAAEAHKASGDGRLVLIDIRSHDEWRETGVPATAWAISMHQAQPAFLKALAAATNGNKAAPIALICATGSRSAFLAGWLRRYGYTAVSEVAEGVEGSSKGIGWARAALPMRRWQPGAVTPVAAAR
ncbi:MAG: rhodanese-like domain-containing protein [Hyphomicrobiaceae bacterium]